MKKTRALAAGAVLALALGAAACGDDDDDDVAATAPKPRRTDAAVETTGPERLPVISHLLTDRRSGGARASLGRRSAFSAASSPRST